VRSGAACPLVSIYFSVATVSVATVNEARRREPMSIFPRIAGRRGICAPLFLAVSLALSAVLDANAAVPNATYEKWQREAPEALTIEVVKVVTESTRDGEATRTAVFTTAKVRSIERSQSGLEEGTLIKIVYTNLVDDVPTPGEGPVPRLAPGKVYRAFLKQGAEQRQYIVAAGAGSFRSTGQARARERTPGRP
jgi:hypothetical protein